jgi:hypothetical protein
MEMRYHSIEQPFRIPQGSNPFLASREAQNEILVYLSTTSLPLFLELTINPRSRVGDLKWNLAGKFGYTDPVTFWPSEQRMTVGKFGDPHVREELDDDVVLWDVREGYTHPAPFTCVRKESPRREDEVWLLGDGAVEGEFTGLEGLKEPEEPEEPEECEEAEVFPTWDGITTEEFVLTPTRIGGGRAAPWWMKED